MVARGSNIQSMCESGEVVGQGVRVKTPSAIRQRVGKCETLGAKDMKLEASGSDEEK